jgi:hypothetical protein
MAVPIPNSAKESKERIFEKNPFNPRYSIVKKRMKIFLVAKFKMYPRKCPKVPKKKFLTDFSNLDTSIPHLLLIVIARFMM